MLISGPICQGNCILYSTLSS